MAFRTSGSSGSKGSSGSRRSKDRFGPSARKSASLFELGALPYAVLTSQRTWRTHGARLGALAHVHAGDRVLDVGCGPGESAFGMAEATPGVRVTGLDASTTMLRIARLRKSIERAGDEVELVHGDAVHLPFSDGRFDAVTGHSFLYLVPDAVRVLEEVRRVLRPGKRCAFLEPAHGGHPFLLPSSMARRALREPRFVASMALWRIVSKGVGRFDRARFERVFEAAKLVPLDVLPAFDGLGVVGIAERPPLRCLSDVPWSRWNPTDRATLLFVIEGDRILLIRKKRGLGAGKVNGPGGRLEPGETAMGCAIREVEEELCVMPTGVSEAGELFFQFQDGYSLHARVFRATGCIGTPRETDEAVPLWTKTTDIPYGEMWADDVLWLPRLLAGKRFSGRFVFDGDRMLDHAIDDR